MAKEILTRSENMSREYCCSLVKIGEVIPVEGSDFLAKTIVDGFQIVVRRDEVKKGDIMFYASNETELNEKFLSLNNQFEDYERNANYDEVKKLLDKKEKALKAPNNDDHTTTDVVITIDEELKHMRGFFNKYGRVKMITLRKCPSMGYLFGVDAMAKFCPEILKLDLNTLMEDESFDRDFDTVGGELFVKAYMPRTNKGPSTTQGNRRERRRQRNADKIDRLVENQFVFHYDTQQLNKNMYRISPDDVVTISLKMHGTSAIFGNLLVKEPKRYTGFLGKFRTLLNKKVIPSKYRKFDTFYDDIYSSRTVIKNQYLNENVTGGFYGTDVWGEYHNLLKGLIPNGMTIYGEIVGYLKDSESMIQKGYDYGCNVGENKLMIYRITTEGEDGVKKEWEIDEVIDWTDKLVSDNRELLANKIYPYPLLFEGKLTELYPDVELGPNWGNEILELLKKEDIFFMEKDELRCKNKVPREGIVLRINNDPIKEAFKLKCMKFLLGEGKMIDEGIVDMESSMRYSE